MQFRTWQCRLVYLSSGLPSAAPSTDVNIKGSARYPESAKNYFLG